jgi:hypothetical protein
MTRVRKAAFHQRRAIIFKSVTIKEKYMACFASGYKCVGPHVAGGQPVYHSDFIQSFFFLQA